MTQGNQPDRAKGVYTISMAAELVGSAPQNLRLYEQRGLLVPERTAGGNRLYSADDIDRLRKITELLDAGLNLAGIAHVLGLQEENSQLQDRNTDLERHNARLRADRRQR